MKQGSNFENVTYVLFVLTSSIAAENDADIPHSSPLMRSCWHCTICARRQNTRLSPASRREVYVNNYFGYCRNFNHPLLRFHLWTKRPQKGVQLFMQACAEFRILLLELHVQHIDTMSTNFMIGYRFLWSVSRRK